MGWKFEIGNSNTIGNNMYWMVILHNDSYESS